MHAKQPFARRILLAFVLIETWLAGLWQYWKLLFGPLLILAVIFLRGGLAGLVAPRHG